MFYFTKGMSIKTMSKHSSVLLNCEFFFVSRVYLNKHNEENYRCPGMNCGWKLGGIGAIIGNEQLCGAIINSLTRENGKAKYQRSTGNDFTNHVDPLGKKASEVYFSQRDH